MEMEAIDEHKSGLEALREDMAKLEAQALPVG